MDGRVSHRLCFEKQMRESGGKYGGGNVVLGGKGQAVPPTTVQPGQPEQHTEPAKTTPSSSINISIDDKNTHPAAPASPESSHEVEQQSASCTTLTETELQTEQKEPTVATDDTDNPDQIIYSNTEQDSAYSNNYSSNYSNNYSNYVIQDVDTSTDSIPVVIQTVPPEFGTANEFLDAKQIPASIQESKEEVSRKSHYAVAFQKILALDSGPKKRKEFEMLYNKFKIQACATGRTILSEIHLDVSQKTVKPAALGGVAGGEKFISNGILFKLATDPIISAGDDKTAYLYGGKDERTDLAAKAASSELKASNALTRYVFTTPELPLRVFVPVQLILDFNGYRLVMMTVLPLAKDRSWLVYGSSDMGRTVHNDIEEFNVLLKAAAGSLHLDEHICADKFVCFAGDVEGHVDVEGQYYLLDLARTWPPEYYPLFDLLGRVGNPVFYRLLRPEFLLHLKNKCNVTLTNENQESQPTEQTEENKETSFTPLNSDALTLWSRVKEPHESNLKKANIVRLLSPCCWFLFYLFLIQSTVLRFSTIAIKRIDPPFFCLLFYFSTYVMS